MMISELERFLRRDLSVPPMVETLNDVTPAMIEDLRALDRDRASWLLTDTYLKLHVKLRDRGWLEDFVEDVVKKGVDPRGWGVRDLLVAPWERDVHSVLGMSVEKLQGDLATVVGARWWWEPPRNASDVNETYSEFPGLPGVLVRGVPYWWRSPSEALAGVRAQYVEEMLDDSLAVAVRRWIARRLAWHLKVARGGPQAANPQAIVDALGVAPATVTDDAAIALAALVRELRLPFDPNLHVRGYVGPDDWYGG